MFDWNNASNGITAPSRQRFAEEVGGFPSTLGLRQLQQSVNVKRSTASSGVNLGPAQRFML